MLVVSFCLHNRVSCTLWFFSEFQCLRRSCFELDRLIDWASSIEGGQQKSGRALSVTWLKYKTYNRASLHTKNMLTFEQHSPEMALSSDPNICLPHCHMIGPHYVCLWVNTRNIYATPDLMWLWKWDTFQECEISNSVIIR